MYSISIEEKNCFKISGLLNLNISRLIDLSLSASGKFTLRGIIPRVKTRRFSSVESGSKFVHGMSEISNSTRFFARVNGVRSEIVTRLKLSLHSGLFGPMQSRSV